METALQRTGQEVAGTAGSGGVDKNDPDLVAYWTFDEGRGYVVHDASGHGHDLFLTNEPQWQVGHSTLAGHLNDFAEPHWASCASLVCLSMIAFLACSMQSHIDQAG